MYWHGGCLYRDTNPITMTISSNKMIKAFTAAILLTIVTVSAGFAQTASASKSRIAVVSNENKTNIWVSDFPKQTSIVVTDSENNLLSMITTNQYGAAFISLPQGINTEVIVKTLNGEVTASKKAFVKKAKEEENVVANEKDNSTKA